MANLNAILQTISIKNDGTTTIPAVTDEIYTMRVNLINSKLEWLFNHYPWVDTYTALVDGTDEVDFPAYLIGALVLPDVKLAEGADVEDSAFISKLQSEANDMLADYISMQKLVSDTYAQRQFISVKDVEE